MGKISRISWKCKPKWCRHWAHCIETDWIPDWFYFRSFDESNCRRWFGGMRKEEEKKSRIGWSKRYAFYLPLNIYIWVVSLACEPKNKRKKPEKTNQKSRRTWVFCWRRYISNNIEINVPTKILNMVRDFVSWKPNKVF